MPIRESERYRSQRAERWLFAGGEKERFRDGSTVSAIPQGQGEREHAGAGCVCGWVFGLRVGKCVGRCKKAAIQKTRAEMRKWTVITGRRDLFG